MARQDRATLSEPLLELVLRLTVVLEDGCQLLLPLILVSALEIRKQNCRIPQTYPSFGSRVSQVTEVAATTVIVMFLAMVISESR